MADKNYNSNRALDAAQDVIDEIALRVDKKKKEIKETHRLEWFIYFLFLILAVAALCKAICYTGGLSEFSLEGFKEAITAVGDIFCGGFILGIILIVFFIVILPIIMLSLVSAAKRKRLVARKRSMLDKAKVKKGEYEKKREYISGVCQELDYIIKDLNSDLKDEN